MILGSSTFLVLLFALLIDRFIGDPDWLWQRLPHPVAMFGNAISWADKRVNKIEYSEIKREKYGFVIIAILMILSIVTGAILSTLFLSFGVLGLIIETCIVAIFLAQKSLADHVRAVADGLQNDGLAGARKAVSMIVGRDPNRLDEPAICRAAIESLAENASDGVVAPAFWYAVFGLPGLFAYKMLNTADSMIGHMNDRYRAFGRASAKFDDFANWLPARLTGVLIILTAKPTLWLDHLKIMLRDAKLHRSPNAGWPESAMAAVTTLALGGPRIYAGDQTDEPFMNDQGNKAPDAKSIDHAITIFWRAMTIGFCLVLILVASQLLL